MQINMVNGTTSFTICPTIAELMHKYGVDDENCLVTKYHNVKNEKVAKLEKVKYIYLAYDAETALTNGKLWHEAEFLTMNTPHLIITLSKKPQKFFKRQGFNTYYLPMGYDDLMFKKQKVKKDMHICFAGTFDEERASMFYYRQVIIKELIKMLNSNNGNGLFTNFVKYRRVHDMYASSLMGLNDVIEGLNMRCYEIPVSGCLMMVNDVIRKHKFPLKHKKHMYVYKGVTDLVDTVKYYCENPQLAIEMGKKAQEIMLKYPISKNVKKMVKDCL